MLENANIVKKNVLEDAGFINNVIIEHFNLQVLCLSGVTELKDVQYCN